MFPQRLGLARIFSGIVVLFIAASGVEAQSVAAAAPTPQTECTGFAFDQAPGYQTGFNPTAVATADFDGDGMVDIITADSTGVDDHSGFSILRGFGNGTFAPKFDFFYNPTIVLGNQQLWVEDIDGDGMPDVILRGTSLTHLAIMRNISAGPGNFTFDAPHVLDGNGFKDFSWLAFADFDSDGKVDIAAMDSQRGISLYRNTTDGSAITFAAGIDTGIALLSLHIITADFDGDGRTDLAADTAILRNTSTGPGNFGFAPFDIRLSSGLATADLDNDGKLDLVGIAAQGVGNRVFTLRNLSTPGSLSFGPQQLFDVGSVYGPGGLGVVTADVNGDGKMDVVTMNSASNSVTVLTNTSSGTGSINFAPHQVDYGVGYYPRDLVAADVDGDQKPDIVTANSQENSVSVVINQSTAEFVDFKTRHDYVTAAKEPVSNLAVADFDGDGNADLAASYFGRGFVFFSLYVGDGTGRFYQRIDNSTLYGSLSSGLLQVADFDSDGRPDIALLVGFGSTGDSIVMYHNTSTGPHDFEFETSSVLLDGPSSDLNVLDFNGDGKKDLVVRTAGYEGGVNLAAFRNNSVGNTLSFEEVGNIRLQYTSVGKMIIGDFDNDGKQDLAVPVDVFTPESTHLYSIRFYLGNDSGFTTHDLVSPQLGNLISADVDMDGRDDILGEDGHLGTDLYYFHNAGGAAGLNFDVPVISPNVFIDPIFAADFDGNGKMDVLSESLTELTILGNVIDPPSNQILSKPTAFAASLIASSRSAVSDLDKDGRPDVAISWPSSTNGTVSVLLDRPCVHPGGPSPTPTPTPAPPVTISGRVEGPDGRGIRNAVVTLIDPENNARTALTSSLGFYSFTDVTPGRSYRIQAASKRYRFSQENLSVTGDTSRVDFIGLE